MTLAQKLANRIAHEEAELARMQADHGANLKAAQRRLGILQKAQQTLQKQPDLEQLVADLGDLGVQVGE